MFLQYFKKKPLQLSFCSIAMQNIQIFYGGRVMFVVTCYLKNLCPSRSFFDYRQYFETFMKQLMLH